MPMATPVTFSPNAESLQTNLDFQNANYTSSQVHQGGNINISELGTCQNNRYPSSDLLSSCTEQFVLVKEATLDIPYVRMSVIEQPKNKWRYRYQSEKGSHGPLPGFSSCESRKTFPTVKVENFPRNYEIVVKASLYTNETNPVLHVHHLSGPKCEDGTCTIKMNEDGTCVFQDLTISCAAKKTVGKILFQRKLSKENSNFSCAVSEQQKKQLEDAAKDEAKTIDLNSVRLCFEAFYRTPGITDWSRLCPPVFSDPVADLRSTEAGDLKIIRLSRVTGSVAGGDEVFLLCAKVNKKDIKVRFYDPASSWEGFGKFSEADVHYQYAIVFQTPAYYPHNIRDRVKVQLQLQRGNGDLSEPVDFIYVPDDPDEERISKKRKKNGLYQEFDRSSGDLYSNVGAEVYAPMVQNQLSLVDESVSDNSLGSSNYAGCSSENLDSDLSSLMSLSCFSEEELFNHPLLLENPTESNAAPDDSTALLNRDPLFSAVNVPRPIWYHSDSPFDGTIVAAGGLSDVHSSVQVDSVALHTEQPENVKNKSSSVKHDVAAKSRTIEDKFSKLYISGNSTELGANNRSEKERLVVKKKESLPQTVSDSSLKKFWYSLAVAVKKGNPFDFLKNSQLIALSDENGNTLLHLAVELNPECEFLIESLLKACGRAPGSLINLTNKDYRTALHIAVKAKIPSVVRLLLKYGADTNIVDKNGFSSYHLAVCVNSAECLHELLQKSHYNSPPERFNLDCRDNYGLTPLHRAAKNGLIECIKLLCNNGANVNEKSMKDGRTPLHYAVQQDCRVVKVLLEQKSVCVDAEDYGGNTPLHLACDLKNLEIIRMLMLHDANPLFRNYDDITPYQFAEENQEMRELLSGTHNFKKPECDKDSRKIDFPDPGSCNKELSTEGDSGYISGELPHLSADLVRRLSMLLDPPSDSWRTLMLFTIVDDDFEKNIHKLSPSPTRAILNTFFNHGGTVDSLIAALDFAQLQEARDIIAQHCSTNTN